MQAPWPEEGEQDMSESGSDGEGYSSPEAEWTEKEGDNEEDDGVPLLGSPEHEGWRVSEKRGGRRVSDVSR